MWVESQCMGLENANVFLPLQTSNVDSTVKAARKQEKSKQEDVKGVDKCS